MSLSCVVIDDEPLAQKLLESNIGMIDYLRHLASFSDADSAAKFLERNSADLVFLDIQMPGTSGMELAHRLKGPMIIFTTAFDHYAVQGFEVKAVDYLLKPITFKRFKAACEKAYELHRLRKNEQAETADHILVRSEHKLVKLFFSDIQYIEGLKDYVKIHTISDPKPVLTRTNLRGIGEQLPAQFRRVHKSYIVNMQHVRESDKDSVTLRTATVPLGQSYREDFRAGLAE